jgi:antitoxin (DNA-binding transcriptional repressor) of toxin-antitoxin stability system
MLRPQAEQLIDRARAGERLNSADRRHCIAYLMAVHPEMTKAAMADVFGVGESMIRQDFQKIRQEKAKLVKEDDIGLVIADIAMTFEKQVIDIERSKNKCTLGSRAYLEHCRAIARMQVERVQLLQELGYYPKSLGSMTVQRFDYKAIVTKDGSVDTRAVNIDAQGVIDAEIVEDQLALPAPETINEFEQ